MKKSFFLLLAIFSAVVSYAQPQDRRTMDWAAFNRYAAANAEVTESPLVVFMGDSITDNWAQMRPGFFSSHNYIGRGISGQTVEHMLARFQQDVIDLHPRAVAIMAGVNNIAGNNGKIDFEDVVAFADAALDGEVSGAHAFYDGDIFGAVYSTNLLMRACDVLVTKPSELAYYPVPKLMIKHVGGHEVWGAIRAAELGDGTYEMENAAEVCAMVDAIQVEPELIGMMCLNIVAANTRGVYDGAYQAVRLAVEG